MNEFPEFKTKEEETEFFEIFDKKLKLYKILMDKVKNEFLSSPNINLTYHSLPGTVWSEIRNITRDVAYSVFMEKCGMIEKEQHFEDEFMNK